MKKVLALSLALIMALSMSAVAFAVTVDQDPAAGVTVVFNGYATFEVALATGYNDAAPGATVRAIPENGSAAIDYSDFNDDFNFTYKIVSGNVESIKVKKDSSDDTAYIAIKLADDYSPDLYDFEVDLKFREKSSGLTNTWTLTADDVGYNTTPVLGLIDSDDEAELDLYTDGPVFDFDDCDYGRVEYDMYHLGTIEAVWKGVESDCLYLGVDTTVDTDFLKAYEDIDFEEANFVGKPSLAGTAKVYFYTDSDKVKLYEVKDGKFTLVEGATYNTADECWTFTARTLGNYVATTKAIPDAVAVDDGKTNPDTGSNGLINLAVVAAVVSLAAVGAVSLKK